MVEIDRLAFDLGRICDQPVRGAAIEPEMAFDQAVQLALLGRRRLAVQRHHVDQQRRRSQAIIAVGERAILIMHAVIFGMLGISDEQRRKASPVHICWASAEKAKLEVVDTIETMAAKPSARLVSRILLLKDWAEMDLVI